MNSTIDRAVDWMRRRAENVVAGMLGIMFVCFLIQIVFRYFFNFPIGWTSELSVVMWLYMTLLGSAFWLKESEEVRFDLISGSLGPTGRRVVGLVVAVAAVILFGMAMPATIKYVTFMKVESSSYLKIRLDILYSVYIVFAVAMIVRYAWSIVSLLRGEAPEEADATKASSGTMNPTSPSVPRARHHRRLEHHRAAGRLRDDRRVHPLAVRLRPRHGDRRRAAAERHDGEPAAARHPAVHPRRLVHEHRQHHGQAAALLQRDRRALPRRARAGERPAEPSSSRACRAPRSPTPRPRAS